MLYERAELVFEEAGGLRTGRGLIDNVHHGKACEHSYKVEMPVNIKCSRTD